MEKNIYVSPEMEFFSLEARCRVMVSASGGAWDDSIEGVGGNWGGLDVDDSQYGL